MKKPFTFLFLCMILLSANSIFAQTKLSVQGVIRLSDGNAIEDAEYPIIFKLYDAANGGNLLWEEVQPNVKVTSGIYSTILGEINTLDLQFDQFYFLSLTVEGEELQPRASLTSAPYSNAVLGLDNMFPSTGNIGIGTLSPTAELEVIGDVGIAGGLDVAGSKFHVASNGWVGVGTSNPGNPFHINVDQMLFTDSLGNTPYFRIKSNTGKSFIMAYFPDASIPQMQIKTEAGGGVLKLGANDHSEAIVINNNGYVAINQTWADVALDVVGSIEYTGTITDVSDRRLKENLTDVTDVLPKLEKLNAFTYNMIDDPTKEREFGLIAQDVQQVFPEMVSIVNPEHGYLGVSYIQLVPVLVQANKELQQKIEELEKADAEMKELITALQMEKDKLNQTVNAQKEISDARMSSLETKINEILGVQSVSKVK